MPSKRSAQPSWRGSAKRPRKGYKAPIKKNVRPRGDQISIKRTFYAGNWAFGTASTSDFWRYIQTDMTWFNNFSEFQSVFDEYKVNAIKITYRPTYDNTQNISSVTAGQVLQQPQAFAHVVVDPVSTLIPGGIYGSSSLNSMLEQEDVKTYTLNKPFSVYFKPKVFGDIYNTGTASVVQKSPWIRTFDPAALYRGFHMYLQQNNFSTGNVNIKLDFYVTFYVSFRNIK